MPENSVDKPINRRGFIKKSAVAVASYSVVSCTASQEHTTTGPRYGMVIDLKKCYGCHSCSVACKAQYDVPLGVWRSWVKVSEKGKFPDTKRNFLPVLCNHCKKPSCVSVCPTGATYQRDDGIVVVSDDVCVGCKYCVINCPYDKRFIHPDKQVASKCDFCVDRVVNGVEPSCVNTCPPRARVFGDLNDPNSEISKIVSKNAVTVDKEFAGTMPRVFYIDMERSETFYKQKEVVL